MRGFLIKSLAILIILAFVVGYVAIDNRSIDVNDYEIYSKKFSKSFDGYTIAFISDFHNSYYYDQVIEKVQAQAPNIILLGGDMITIGNSDRSNTLALVDGLLDIAPVYFVTGNHESMNSDGSVLVSELTMKGVSVINNGNSPITINSDGTLAEANSVIGVETEEDDDETKNAIYLHAIPDYSCLDDEALDQMDDYFKSVLEKKKNELVEDQFNILLMHRANLFDYVDDFGFDLVLTGHIHGGVMRLPFVGGMFSPDRNEFFPKYTKGLYYGKKSKMIVNGGVDYDLTKPRIFNGPEIVTVTLRRQD